MSTLREINLNTVLKTPPLTIKRHSLTLKLNVKVKLYN